MSRRPYSTRSVILRPPLDDPDLAGAWTSECHGNRLVDLTPGGHNGTPTPSSSTVRSILGSAQLFTGASYIDCGDLNTDIRTLEFWLRPTVANDYIFDIKAGTHFVYLTAGAIDPSGWTDPEIYVDGITGTPTPVLGRWNHVVITTDTAIDADNFNFGVATANYFDGEITGVRVYSAAKSAAWVAARYREGAAAIQFRTDWGVPDDVAPVAAGGYLGQGRSPVAVQSGTWQIATPVIGGVPVKVLVCVTAGIIAIPARHFFATPTEAAFGTWEFTTYKTNAGLIDVNFIANATTLTTGYSLRHDNLEMVSLQELGVGAVCTNPVGVSHSAIHTHKITRRFDGTFDCYLDGSATAWGTGVDLTTTTSAYFLIDADAGCAFVYSGQRGEGAIRKYLGEV